MKNDAVRCIIYILRIIWLFDVLKSIHSVHTFIYLHTSYIIVAICNKIFISTIFQLSRR